MNPIRFDLDQGTFSISNGTEGAWSWEDIAGCEVLNEEARFHKSSPPFSHRVFLPRSLTASMEEAQPCRCLPSGIPACMSVSGSR